MKNIINGFKTVLFTIIITLFIAIIGLALIGSPTWLYIKFNEPLYMTIYVIHFIVLCWSIGHITPGRDEEYTDER